MNVISGQLNGKGKKFAIIASRFNEFITNKLVSGAEDILKKHLVDDGDISIYWVPGAFEIPVIAKKVAESKKVDGIICLGCIIRGATPHFDYISSEVSKGIASIGLKSRVPIIFGVLTTDSIEQAIERAGTKAGNKGADSAMTAIEMVNLYSLI
ncbi:MAG: 6,7-dimethyl-8-ribityllumazine synthase [Endomicrobium sp.]|nr:6,7-dimethyl-8-ribityllumazine synthase [Endomicrobium sp.]